MNVKQGSFYINDEYMGEIESMEINVDNNHTEQIKSKVGKIDNPHKQTYTAIFSVKLSLYQKIKLFLKKVFKK